VSAGPSASYRRALRHVDLRLLFGALTVSAVGSWAYNVAIVAFVYNATHSPSWVGAVALGRFVPALLFSSYAGVVAERFERVGVMLCSDLFSAIFMVAMAATMAADGPPLVVIALAALTTTTCSVYMPATSAMVPQIAGEDDLAPANALNAAIDNVAILVGPALAGALLVVLSPAAVTAFNAGTFLVSAALVSRVRARSHPTDVTAAGGPIRQMLVGVRAIGESSTAALLVGFSVLASFVYGTDTVVFVVVSQDKLGTGSHGLGYLLAALGVGGLAGATFVNRLASSARLGMVITVGMVVYCVPTALLVVVHSPSVAFALVVVRGAATLVVDTLAVTALQRTLAPDLVARVFGVFMALVLAAISLGAVLTPLLLSTTSLDTTLLVLGLGIPLLVVLAAPWTTALDRVGARRLAQLGPRIAALEGLNLLTGAGRATIERLAAAATEVLQPEPYRDVVVEGEAATALYVLVDGEVEVRARGEGRRTRHVRTMTAPAYFGEIGLLQRVPRTATVRTTMPCRFLRIDGDVFLDALSDGGASASLLQAASSRLQRTHPSRGPVEIPEQRTAASDMPVS
jgi:CRP-like cAMP-binding protein/predicted MFS family arabinose efflux permease